MSARADEERTKLCADIERFKPAALRRLAEAQPGYPSGHDGTGSGSTQPERYEATLGDDAVRDLERLRKAEKTAMSALRDEWGVVTKWGVARDARSLEIADPTDEMWCRSCLTIGHFSTRRASGGVNCDWCASTLRDINTARSEMGRRPLTELPREALQAHASGRRVTTRDVERWTGLKNLRRDRNERRKKPVETPVTFMRSTVRCDICGRDEIPVPDGTTAVAFLADHKAECAQEAAS